MRGGILELAFWGEEGRCLEARRRGVVAGKLGGESVEAMGYCWRFCGKEGNARRLPFVVSVGG